MRQALVLHPQSRCAAVSRIDVEAARPRPGNLVLRYVVTGEIGGLRLPPPDAPSRADGLWQHTCFEVFVHTVPGAPYYEFNFAPSAQWAAYRFTGYRSGMVTVSEINAPRFEMRSNGGTYELHAMLELDRLPGLAAEAPWRLGLAAVIEEKAGRKSYWALAHPPGRPDFHHSDCFATDLAAAWRP